MKEEHGKIELPRSSFSTYKPQAIVRKPTTIPRPKHILQTSSEDL
jgi:hypothetical protein